MAERLPVDQENLSNLNPEKGNRLESFRSVLESGTDDEVRAAMNRLGEAVGKSKDRIEEDIQKVLAGRANKAAAAPVSVSESAPESVGAEAEAAGNVADEPIEKLDISDLTEENKEKKTKERKSRKWGRKIIAIAALIGVAGGLWAGIKHNSEMNDAPGKETSNSTTYDGLEYEDGSEYDFIYDASKDLNLSPDKVNAYGNYSPGAFRTPIESGGDKDTFNENMIEGWATTPIDLAATCVAYETVMAGGSMSSGIDLKRINDLADQMKTNPDTWKSFYERCSDLTTKGLEDAGITSRIEKAPASYYSLWTDSAGNIKQAVYANANGGTDAMVYRDTNGNMLMMKLDWCGNVGYETPINDVPIEQPPEEPPLEVKNPNESSYNNVRDSYQGNNGETFTATEETATDSFVEPDGTTITIEGNGEQDTYEIPIETVPASQEALDALNDAKTKAASGNAEQVVPKTEIATGSVGE